MADRLFEGRAGTEPPPSGLYKKNERKRREEPLLVRISKLARFPYRGGGPGVVGKATAAKRVFSARRAAWRKSV